MIIAGIDTSNYTTSLALIDGDGKLLANIKAPLPVASGERGLRQSDAVFAHIKNIPTVMKAAEEALGGEKISAVGVSERPRNLDGSYMPCFLVGADLAKSISTLGGIPLYSFSHQCGHVMAGIYSSGRFDLLKKEFCAFHVSGGTTEMLRVKYEGKGFSSELVGATEDINAGQLIDRVGVHLGLPFPCGVHLEQLALTNRNKIPKRRVSLKDFKINLSGIENIAKRLYSDTADKALVSAFVLDHIGDALKLLSEKYEERYGKSEFLYAGGVMSNSIIKEKLNSAFSASFAEPALSADNGVGIAYLAYLAHKRSF